jgi:hypothetical protein
MTQVQLGAVVRDVITGFVGTAIQKRETLNGNVQLAVQPKNKDGENALPEAHFLDHHTLKVAEDCEQLTHLAIEPTQEPIPLGVEVRDKATGFEGTTMARITFINGCVFYEVAPKKRSKMFDDNPLSQVIEGLRLSVISKKPVLEVQREEKPTGGPSIKVTRQKVMR